MRTVLSLLVAVFFSMSCAHVRGMDSAEGNPDPDFTKLLPGATVELPAQKDMALGHVNRGARAFERTPHTAPTPFAEGPGAAPLPESLLNQVGVEFHIFSIGQADSMLVIAPGRPPERSNPPVGPNVTTLLYDLGELGWNTRRNCVHVRDEIEQLTGAHHVDYLVLSHFHQDHVGGPPRLITSPNGNTRQFLGGGVFCLLEGDTDWFTVGTLIDRGDGEQAFKPVRQASHQWVIDSTNRWIANGTLQRRVAAGFAPGLINMGPAVAVEVLATAGHVAANDPGALENVESATPGTYRIDQQASPNDFSIALEFTVGSNFELFTAGDLSGGPSPNFAPFIVTQNRQVYTNVEAHMVNHWESQTPPRESDVEVYVVNHHGSHNSSIPALVDALEPEVVIYSAGARHGHPREEIADRFHAAGSDQMLTHSADDDEWPGGVFPDRYGNGWNNPVGDILVFAPLNGDWYTVATQDQAFEYPTFSDIDEQ